MRGNHVVHQYTGMELLISPHHACMRGNHVVHQYTGMELLINPHHACMRGNHVVHQYTSMQLLINPHHACMRGNHVVHQYMEATSVPSIKSLSISFDLTSPQTSRPHVNPAIAVRKRPSVHIREHLWYPLPLTSRDRLTRWLLTWWAPCL